MAQRIEKFSLVAAAGAGQTFQDHSFLDGVVTRVELYVPPGHSGLTTWQFWHGNSQILPNTPGASIVADDRRFTWDVEDFPTQANTSTSSGYRSRYSNSDTFAHTFYIEVWLEEIEPLTVEPELPVLVVPFAS